MDKIEKIVWTELGISSLEQIVSYIALDSEFYASKMANSFVEIIENIKMFPEIGRIVPEYNTDNLREVIYQNYRIVYQIVGSTINIIYIGHGTQLLPDF